MTGNELRGRWRERLLILRIVSKFEESRLPDRHIGMHPYVRMHRKVLDIVISSPGLRGIRITVTVDVATESLSHWIKVHAEILAAVRNGKY